MMSRQFIFVGEYAPMMVHLNNYTVIHQRLLTLISCPNLVIYFHPFVFFVNC